MTRAATPCAAKRTTTSARRGISRAQGRPRAYRHAPASAAGEAGAEPTAPRGGGPAYAPERARSEDIIRNVDGGDHRAGGCLREAYRRWLMQPERAIGHGAPVLRGAMLVIDEHPCPSVR